MLVYPLHQLSKQKSAKACLANFISPRNVNELLAKKQAHQIRYLVFTVILLLQDQIQWQHCFNTLANSDIEPNLVSDDVQVAEV